MENTVLFLGAGATNAAVNLLTEDILPAVLKAKATLAPQDPSGSVNDLVSFLISEFHVVPGSGKEHYPGLPLLMSLLDTALDRREVLNAAWDLNKVAQLRQALEFGIFDVLESTLQQAPTSVHFDLLQKLFPVPAQPCVITTNYDLIADAAMMHLSEQRTQGGLPNYHCGFANLGEIGPAQRFGTLLKLHGSLNWLMCDTCQRLELGDTAALLYGKVLNRVLSRDVRNSILTDGAQCTVCHSKLRPLLIAPSHLKDYRNPHLAQVWYEAQRVLRGAQRVIFIGYSMPDDDVEVVYLVKRSLSHITDPKKITVVAYHPKDPEKPNDPPIAAAAHPIGRRYRTLFGDVDWHPEGLNDWLADQA